MSIAMAMRIFSLRITSRILQFGILPGDERLCEGAHSLEACFHFILFYFTLFISGFFQFRIFRRFLETISVLLRTNGLFATYQQTEIIVAAR